MAPGKLDFEGLGGSSPFTDGKKSPIRALPGSWYLSEDMYQLERRAIFTSKWLLTTHLARFRQAGDFVKFDIAGYQFIIARDRKGQINAFHNTCRHRAYPVVDHDKTSGRAQIFACKYHGWSYGLDGKLAKAPRYDDLEGFDKARNGLFRVHTHVDKTGFIWVNLDSSDKPEAWEDQFRDIDVQERYDNYNFDDYEFHSEWQLEGTLNWKLCADNYNECYHCRTSHPTIPTLVDVESIKAESDFGWTKHTGAQTEEQKRDGLAICATYYFPNVSTNVLPNYIMLQRFVPHSAQRTAMHYQIFRNKHAEESKFELIDKLYHQVMAEDKALCSGANANIARGVFVNGAMHPRLESASLHFQAKTREAVKAHLERERRAGGAQIWPARPTHTGATNDDAATKEDEELCASLACSNGPKSDMAW